MNPFERKFKDFAHTLSAKNAQGHADHIATASSNTFRDKPFTEEYKGVYQMAIWGQSLAQIVTFATTAGLGVFALQHIVPLSWGIYVAVPLALLFALGVERIKRATLAIASKHWLKYKTFGLVGTVAVAVMGISIAAALYGAKELPSVVYPSPTRAVDASMVQTLNADIDRLQADIDRVQANLGREKNWTAENRTLPRLQQQRAALIAQRETAQNTATNQAQADYTEALAKRADKVDKMQWYAVGAAILAELIFLLCTGFVLYYLFRAFAETEQAKGPVPPAPIVPVSLPQHNGTTITQNLRITPEPVTATPVPVASARADGKRATLPTSVTPTLAHNQRICDHCQQPYTYGHARQRFCTEKCRIENWQVKNGKEIRHRINAKG